MKPIAVAVYGRVSTSGQSTDAQIAECQQYAARCGYEVVSVYQDTISGLSSKDDRPELSRLLDDAFARKFEAVIVYSIDRIGRSLHNCLEILETLKNCHTDFISLKQQIDTVSSPVNETFLKENFWSPIEPDRWPAGAPRAPHGAALHCNSATMPH